MFDDLHIRILWLFAIDIALVSRTAVSDIRTCGRSAQGVQVMKFKEEGDRVISIALAEKEEDEESGAPEAEQTEE